MLDRRLILVSGKGGVGKSAVTAALAALAARLGKRVLALAMRDGAGLAAHLGVDNLDYEPVRISPGLYGAVVDRGRALDEYLKLQVHLPNAMPTRQLSRALHVLIDTAPGIREIVTMGKPLYEVWKKDWDLVVADAPPLGQLQSYLDAPQTITGLVPTGAVREQASRLEATLSDPATSGLVLVTTPEELPMLETVEALGGLTADQRVDIAAVAANRVLSPLGLSEEVVAAVPAGPIRDAGLLHVRLQTGQARWLTELPPGPRLPFLFGLFTPAEVSARLADEWERTR